MAVKIRLMRVGKKKQPTYRVVVADARSPRDGRFIEIIGQYEPRADPSRVSIDSDKALAWLAKGAQPTEQVGKLLDIAGVWERFRAESGHEAAARPKPKVPKAKAAPATPAADAPTGGATGTPSAPEPVAEAPEASEVVEAPEASEGEGA